MNRGERNKEPGSAMNVAKEHGRGVSKSTFAAME
jgi:hypothetical protein